MNRLKFHGVILGAATCVLLFATSFVVADEPHKHTNSVGKKQSITSLDEQLANTRLKLAKLELQNALAANERTTGIYSAVTLELLRRNVAIAETHVAELSRGDRGDPHVAHLRELEGAHKIAELRWKGAVKLNDRLPDSVDPTEIERLRLRAEVARLAMARARDPAHVASPLGHIQWQLGQLRQEVLELTLRVEELSNRD